MKKVIKRVIAAALCAAMLISAGSAGAMAATETDCDGNCKHSPVIILPGINHSPTYLYDENDQPVMNGDSQIGGTLLILNEAALSGSAIAKAVASVLATLVLQTNVGLDKVAYDLVCDLFSIQRCDENGDHVENLKTQRWYHSLEHMTEDEVDWVYRMVPMKSLVDVIGEDHTYFFTFNLVGDPMDSADDLHEYIEMVKEQTGHDEVTLLPVSLGGTILTAYLDKYGHDGIDQIVNAVACLDGTDIVADMYAREWRLCDQYLYQEFIPQIFVESNDSPTLGYLINTLLHIFPRSGIDALLSGAMSGIIDTMMVNCPQFWAMIPSYRYEALAERYLTDKPVLKARTDRFQQARLNLGKNILAAVEDGVRVNSIAGANLDLGEQEYTYFNIVASAEKVNSDGIINLSSTTMGATGAPGEKTLKDVEYEKNTYCTNPNHNHVSPDNMVDVSTAVLPENTWIFLEQHHEVGNNDVVLNLAKAIILGEVTDVNDNPEKYPQFNGSCTTKYIRRWRLPDAYNVLEKEAKGEMTLTAEDKAELNAAIAEGEAVIASTIADQKKVEAAEDRLNNILHKVGAEGYENIEEEESFIDPILESILLATSKASLFLLGGGSLVDRILSPFRALFDLAFGGLFE
ncbi:MAG: hypothetical protein IJZ07_01285 [Clostridia bacterium]|nr:hypothetical protein [Clostridia bacterium]